MSMLKLGIASLFALGAAACSKPADDSNIIIDDSVNAAEAANADVEVLPLSETGTDAASNSAFNESNADSAATQPGDPNQPVLEEGENALIPLAMQGRWGINRADCDASRSDNKGLIELNRERIKFYESIATLTMAKKVAPTQLVATFRFQGEGASWSKDQALTLNGDTLTRADRDGTFIYKRCG